MDSTLNPAKAPGAPDRDDEPRAASDVEWACDAEAIPQAATASVPASTAQGAAHAPAS